MTFLIQIRLYTLVLLGIFSVTFAGMAKCGPDFSVFPKSKQIQANSLFLLEGYLLGEEIIMGLNESYPIYLEAKDHKVPLRIKEIRKGAVNLSQALLEPAESLIVGKTYQLKIANLKDHQIELVKKHNALISHSEFYSWQVVDTTLKEAPTPLQNLQFETSSYEEFGCGPAAYATFEFSPVGHSELLILTELKEITSGKVSSFYLFPGKELRSVEVGHGMCSGAFDFEVGSEYEVRFKVMDFTGQFSEAWTDRIRFKSPVKKLASL